MTTGYEGLASHQTNHEVSLSAVLHVKNVTAKFVKKEHLLIVFDFKRSTDKPTHYFISQFQLLAACVLSIMIKTFVTYVSLYVIHY